MTDLPLTVGIVLAVAAAVVWLHSDFLAGVLLMSVIAKVVE